MDEFLKNFLEELKKAGSKGSPVVLFILPALFISCFLLLIMFLFQINNSILPANSNTDSSNLETIYVGEERTKLLVDVADSSKERADGLMFIQSLPTDQGMLFIFEDEEFRSFWMQNTYISLDIIFLNSNKEVINFHEFAMPLDTTKRYQSNAPAKYVLEVNGGWGRAHNLKPGDKIEFDF